jgi:hypothetical protein
MSYLVSSGVSEQHRGEDSQCLIVNTDREIAVVNQLMYGKKGVVWLIQISHKSTRSKNQSYFNNSL